MPIIFENYKPSLFFKNAHVHTIYPALFRKPKRIAWKRTRLELPDGDFLDLDWHNQNAEKLVVLGHGLEGSSNSSYNLAAAHLFFQNGFDVLAWNHRGCSGEINRLPRMYHHGVSDDLQEVMKQTLHYKEVHYIGYSLGGNVVLKYLGEDWNKPSNLKSVVAISSPIDLFSCVEEIHRLRNKLYHNNFLRTLKEKVKKKALVMPNQIDTRHLKNVKTLTDLDTYYTAPLHGFLSAKDYYQKASSRPYLPSITLPTLLIQAKDDPMLGTNCYPYEEAENSENLKLVITNFGGHVAFTQPGSKWHWMEEQALKFITEHSIK